MTHFIRPRVDRIEEIKLLNRLARGEETARIVLIRAESGMGKSELLREIKSQYGKEVLHVFVDFKGGGLNLADILFNVCDTLGWKKFPTLTSAIKAIIQPVNINIKDNILIGQNDIAVALNAPDQHTREMRRSEITMAFISDLRKLKQITLIFDVFEKCDEYLQAWFSSVFLPAIHRSPQISAIIAGQIVPEQTQMWECEQIVLGEIAPEHWQDYAKAIGAKIDPEFIRGCCVALKGKCLSIAQIIEEQRGASA